MRRLLPALLALAALLSACTTDGATETTTTSTVASQPDSTAATPTSTPPTTVPSDVATTDSGRPLAPDFTLALGDGGSYTLSEGAKPVYLVFWAEW